MIKNKIKKALENKVFKIFYENDIYYFPVFCLAFGFAYQAIHKRYLTKKEKKKFDNYIKKNKIIVNNKRN